MKSVNMSEDEIVAQINKELSDQGITPEVEVAPVAAVLPEEDVEEPKAEVSPKSKKRELTEFEKEQMKDGWNPNGEKSAEEFARAGKLYREITKRGDEIQELKQTINEMKSFMDKQRQAGYDQALKELQHQRVEAISMGNVEEVDEIESQIRSMEAPEAKPATPTVHPAVAAFNKRYDDLIQDHSLEAFKIKEFLGKRAADLDQSGLDPEKAIQILESDMKAEFPARFGDPGSLTVERGSSLGASKSKGRHQFSDLTKEQKDCARHFVNQGIMTVEEYIKQLVELGELS